MHLHRSLASRPTVATTCADLADALSHLGQTEEALPLLQKAIQLEPFNPIARKLLVVNLISAKQYSEAKDALEAYLKIFPQDDFMRKLLDRAQGKNPEP